MGSDFVELPTPDGPKRFRMSMIWCIHPTAAWLDVPDKPWTLAYLVGIAEPVVLTESVDEVQRRIDEGEG